MRQMYFGTKQRMSWIKTHSPNSATAMMGSSERLDLSNGGVALRESVNGHMEYTLSWGTLTRAQARLIVDYAYGIHGSGPLYFTDPSAMDQNMLNKAWSAPGITAKDGVPLAGRRRPTIVNNLDSSTGCPVEMARYDLTATDSSRTFHLPIPPGYTASVSVRGDAASTIGLRVQPTVAGVASSAPTILPVAATDSTAAPATFAGGSQAGIDISINMGGAGFITLAGLMVQLRPTGVPADHSRWISGQGASGLKFEGRVQPTVYNLPHEHVGLAVKLVEMEDWL